MRTHILAVCWFFLLSEIARPVDYYVSPTGSNANDGRSLATPFQTIQHAADVMVAGDTCYIRSGTYRETVMLPRSGTAVAPIKFIGYASEEATVSGADVVQGWTPHAGAIYKAAIGWDLGRGTNQIFVDGHMMIEACWPNTSADVLSPRMSSISGGTANHGNGVVTIDDPSLTQPAGFWNGATIVIGLGPANVLNSGLITSYQPGQLTFNLDSFAQYFDFFDPSKGDTYFVVGGLNALDAPLEWALASGTLYLWLPDNDAPASHTIEAKHRPYAFDARSRSFIHIQNLSIFAATIICDGATADCIFDDLNARYVSQFRVIDDYPYRVGSRTTGIILDGARNILRNSIVAYSAGNGVTVLGSDHQVVNNVIHDVGYAGTDCGAVNTGGDSEEFLTPSLRHDIAYNTMYRSGRSMVVHRNLRQGYIRHNDMSDVGRIVFDLGFTYTYGLDADGDGTEIAYNLMRDPYLAHPGVYLDAGATDHVVHHNVIWNTVYGVFLNRPSLANRVYNNTSLGSYNGVVSFGGTDGDMAGTRIINNIATAPISIPAGAGHEESNNLEPPEDPLFVNKPDFDFRLQPNSPAIDTGLLLPPYTDGYTASAPDKGAYEYYTPTWTAGANFCDCPPAVPGPIGHWGLDEGAGPNAFDRSGNTHTGSLINGPVWRGDGKVGGALRFNGADDHVKVASTSHLQLTGDLTIAFWVKRNADSPDYVRLVGKGDILSGARTYGLWFHAPDPRYILFQQYDSAGQPILNLVSSRAVVLGQWHHIAAVIRNGVASIYVDGVFDVSGARSGTPGTSSADLTIGYGLYHSPLNGDMDDVRIYNRALTTAEIGVLADKSLVARWKFDDGAGLTAADASGNGHAGTLSGGPVWRTAGRLGGALHFDGIDDIVRVASTDDLQLTGDLTIAFWVRKTANPPPSCGACYVRLVGKGNIPSGPRTYGVWFNTPTVEQPEPKQLFFQQYEMTDQPVMSFFSGATVAVGQWYHVAAVVNNNCAFMYINGNQEIAYWETRMGIPGTSADPVTIGFGDYHSALNGDMDDVRIYNRALSLAEIRDLAKNHPPIAYGLTITTAEDTSAAVGLPAFDPDDSPLTYTVTSPAHGGLSGTAPNLTYTSAVNYNGPDAFTLKVNDGEFDSSVVTINITVTAVNDAPIANPQAVSTPYNTPVNITLSGSDVEGSALTFTIVTPPANGTLTGTDANRTFTPNIGWFGTSSFTFKVNDGALDSAAATVSITVAAPSGIPAAPTSLTATAVSQTQINLAWADNSNNEDGFKVERSPNGSSSWVQIATVGPNITTFSNTGLTRNTRYYYRVRSHNVLGNSAYSNTDNAKTLN